MNVRVKSVIKYIFCLRRDENIIYSSSHDNNHSCSVILSSTTTHLVHECGGWKSGVETMPKSKVNEFIQKHSHPFFILG
jgi:hypothetical protein